MAIRIEFVSEEVSGQCEARRCLAMTTIRIVAGDKELKVCERCFREMVDQSDCGREIAAEARESLEVKIEAMGQEEKALRTEIERLEGELDVANQELLKMKVKA